MDQIQMKEMTDEQLRAMLESIQQELNERERCALLSICLSRTV
jgi:hypothetical protein